MNAHPQANLRAQACRLALTLLLINALVAAPLASAATPIRVQQQSAALPAGVERVTSVEGITEYRLKNGLRVLMFPDQTKQTVTVNMTYLVGSRHESYGETGMAHLLEHMVFKGTPRHRNIPQRADRRMARGPTARRGRSHQLLRDLRRYGREPQLGARPRSRPDGQLLHRKERPRQRDDRRAQRVRAWARTARSAVLSRDARGRLRSGTTTARRRSARAPTSRTCRSIACRRSTASITSRITPFCTIAGKVDEAKTLALVDKYFGAIPRPTRTLPTNLHHRADAGRRARGHAAPRRRHAARAGALPRAFGRAPGLRRRRHSRASSRRHAFGKASQSSGRNEEGQLDFRLRLPVARPRASRSSARRCVRATRSTPRATR